MAAVYRNARYWKYQKYIWEVIGINIRNWKPVFLFTVSGGIVYSRGGDAKKKESMFGSQAEVLQMNWSFIVLQ